MRILADTVDDIALCPCCFGPATAAEPHTPCPDCGLPLWCYHDFAAGEDVYYCPDCMQFDLTVA